MKKSFLLILAIAIVSCNPESPEAIKSKLIKLKEKRMVINNDIASLERKLEKHSIQMNSGKAIPVKVKQLELEDFNHFIMVNGNVEADKHVFVSPEINGQIEKIYVAEGDKVNKGDLLVALNTKVIESNIKDVKTGLELARKLYKKQKELWEQKIGSEIEYLNAKNAKETAENRLNTLWSQLEMSRIRAPFNGTIEKISGKEGEMASPGMVLLELVNLTEMKITAELSEKYIAEINEGDISTVTFPSLPGIEKRLAVSRTGDVISRNSRTFTIEIKTDNGEKKLKPNLMATILLNDFSTDSALVVPAGIIKNDINGSYLYVSSNKEDKVTAQKKYIKTGLSYKENTMISEGLNIGEKVITSGYSEVSDGAVIKIK